MTTAVTTERFVDPTSSEYIALQRAIDEPSSERILSGREREVRDRVREIVAEEIAPRARAVDNEHTFAHESFQALARAGLVGLVFPESVGGTGDTHVAYAAAMEEITAGCPSTSLIYMTQTHAAYPILSAGSDHLIEHYVPGLLDGSAYGSMAITEPDAGSDVASITTRAQLDEDGQNYRISGSKTFITTGDRADVVVCFVTTDPRAGRDGVTALVIDGDAPGFERGAPLHKMGMHGSSTAELFFSGVSVPATHRLGGEGDGWSIVMASVIKSRISAAAQGIGLARAAYGRALRALTAIHGSRIPDEIGFALAELRGDILQGRLLLLSTAGEVDAGGQPTAGEIGMMKQACTDLGWRASITAMRLLGRYGDLRSVGVEQLARDAKVTQIYDGTNEVQRLLISRDTRARLRTSGLLEGAQA